MPIDLKIIEDDIDDITIDDIASLEIKGEGFDPTILKSVVGHTDEDSDKNVKSSKLHPVKEDGSLDESITLHPESDSSNILESVIVEKYEDLIDGNEYSIRYNITNSDDIIKLSQLYISHDDSFIARDKNGYELRFTTTGGIGCIELFNDNLEGSLYYPLSVNQRWRNSNFEYYTDSLPSFIVDETQIEILDALNIILNVSKIQEKETKTIKEVKDNFTDWTVSKTKTSAQQNSIYYLNNELNTNDVSELITNIMTHKGSYSKSGYNYISVDGYIISSNIPYLTEWTYYNEENNTWEDIYVDFEESSSIYARIKNDTTLIYNGKTYVFRSYDLDSQNLRVVYDLSFNHDRKILTIVPHDFIVDDIINAKQIFEFDDKLLSVNNTSNKVYEIDLENYTAQVSEYQIFYYSINTLYKLTRSVSVSGYYKWDTTIDNIHIVSNYGIGSSYAALAELRHVQEGDQEALYDPSITLDEHSLIIQNINDHIYGTGNECHNRFFAKDNEENKILCTFYKENNVTKFYKFDSILKTFTEISTNLSTLGININDLSIGYNVLNLNENCYVFNSSNYKLYKQSSFENDSLIFEEVPNSDKVYAIIYYNINAKTNEISNIDFVYNDSLQAYQLLLDKEYIFDGDHWSDSDHNPIDASDKMMITNYRYFFDGEYYNIAPVFADITYKTSLKSWMNNVDVNLDTPLNQKDYSIGYSLLANPRWERIETLFDEPGEILVYDELSTNYTLQMTVSFAGYIYEGASYIIVISYQSYNSQVEYLIASEDFDEEGTHFEKDTWYELVNDADNFIKIKKPTLPFDMQYVLNLQAFSCIADENSYAYAKNIQDKIYEIEEQLANFSPTDDSLLKDKLYNYVIPKLIDGNEYSLASDCREFFNNFIVNETTTIYDEEITLNSGEEPEEEYINYIEVVSTFSPTPTPKPVDGLMMTSNNRGNTNSLLGEVSIHASSLENDYVFNATGNVWLKGNVEPVTELPKIKLNSSAIIVEDMFKAILQKNEQTLEQKFNEEIKDWTYEEQFLGTNKKPIYDNANLILNNHQIFEEAGLLSNQEGTLLYYGLDEGIIYSFDAQKTILRFVYTLNYDAVEGTVDKYTNEIVLVTDHFESYWYYDKYLISEGERIESKEITSQDEIEALADFDPENIISGYEDVINLILFDVNNFKKISLQEQIGKLKDWQYDYRDKETTVIDIRVNDTYQLKMSDIDVDLSTYYSGYEIANGSFGADEGYLSVSQKRIDGINTKVLYFYRYNSDEGINVDVYYHPSWNGWRYYDNTEYEGDPLTIDLREINDKDLVNVILIPKEHTVTVKVPITLEEAIDEPLKDKVYEYIIDGVTKEFYKKLDLSSFPTDIETYPDYNPELSGIIIYGDISHPEDPYIIYSVYNEEGIYIKLIIYAPTLMLSDGYLYSDKAFEIPGNVWVRMIDGEISLENPEPFKINEDYIKSDYEYLLNQLIKDYSIPVKLDEKLDEIESPYSIVNYTEDSGNLSSITVKDKETGEETQLTVGGKTQQYMHCFQLSSVGTDYAIACMVTIITSQSTKYNITTFKTWLNNNVGNDKLIGASGTIILDGVEHPVTGLYNLTNDTYPAVMYKYNSNTQLSKAANSLDSYFYTILPLP